MANMAVGSAVDARTITEGLGGRWRGTRGDARCPAHNDRNPSLSIADGDKGSPVVKCHTGCDSLDVIDALRSRGLWPEREPAPQLRVHRGGKAEPNGVYAVPERRQGLGKEIAVYEYRDETGRPLYQAVRFESKEFRQRRYADDGSLAWGLSGTRLVLYRLPELLAADPALTVFVVEGEKDADRLITWAWSRRRASWGPASGATSTPHT
jgi:putative DNA primase/helicase